MSPRQPGSDPRLTSLTLGWVTTENVCGVC
jgi:hypothetical protein